MSAFWNSRCQTQLLEDGQIQAPVAQERRVLWRPDMHQMKARSVYFQASDWSYGPLKSTIFHGFGSHPWIRASVSPEPYKLWPWLLHHWIQQRLRFKRMCRNIVTTTSDLELWTHEASGFGSGGSIHGAISPEPNNLWTWDLHHWIQQRLKFKRICRNTVTTPSDLELWTREVSYISWIWFGWVSLWCHISWTL